MLTRGLVYDIQTSFKGAVYSVKLKMEFSILNQLMNLVKGSLRDRNTYSGHTESKAPTYRNGTAIGRSTAHHSSQLGHSAGVYSRMDDAASGNSEIKLQDLKDTAVLKTTTTTVRVERVRDVESVESGRGKELRRSGSSEMYIIGHDRT